MGETEGVTVGFPKLGFNGESSGYSSAPFSYISEYSRTRFPETATRGSLRQSLQICRSTPTISNVLQNLFLPQKSQGTGPHAASSRAHDKNAVISLTFVDAVLLVFVSAIIKE